MNHTTVRIITQQGAFWIRVENGSGIVMGSLSPSMTVRDAIAERTRVAAFYARAQ